MHFSIVRRSLFAGAAALALLFGCSAGGGDDTFGNTSTGGTASTGGSAGSGQGGEGGGATGGAGGTLIPQGGQGGLEECASSEAEPELTTLDIVILLDRSGSMSGPKWTGSVDAIGQFVNDPVSLGINAGITYFPKDGAANGCDKNEYTTLAVPIAAIGAGEINAGLITSSMGATTPAGGTTPTYGGLEGVLFHATAYQDQNPDHKVIVVFASDGEPNGCPGNQNDIPVIASLAASAYNYNGVETYVIAISGANVGNLNQIAAAGGTGQAYDVTADVTQFAAKMEEIRAAALSCEFGIPDPPLGETLDFDLVNVQYTPGGTTTPLTFPKVENAAACGNGQGWYYDDNASPTQIFLCPASCTDVQGDAEADMKVLFGCESIAE